MSNEYIFFDDAVCERFVQFLATRSVPSQVQADAIAGTAVQFPEDLPDELLDAIEAEYESLMAEQLDMAAEKDGWVTHQAVGINVALADGQTRQMRLPPEIARKLLERFTVEEVHELVTAIALSLDRPASGPLCHKPE